MHCLQRVGALYPFILVLTFLYNRVRSSTGGVGEEGEVQKQRRAFVDARCAKNDRLPTGSRKQRRESSTDPERSRRYELSKGNGERGAWMLYPNDVSYDTQTQFLPEMA